MRERILKRILLILGAALAWAFMLGGAASARTVPYGYDPGNGLPVVYVTIDESQEAIAQAHTDYPENTYGKIADMNGSKDHSVNCIGSVDIKVPEGYTGYWSTTAFSSLTNLELEYIRGRGNSTWDFANKKPYKLKLKAKTDLFGMGASKHWALMANSQDSVLFRNTFTYKLGMEMGLDYCPQGVPVDLVMRSAEGTGTYCEYLGSYVLSETVRVEDSRVNIPELGKKDIDEATITGGYLLAIYHEYQDGDQPASNVFKTAHGVELLHENPEFEEDQTAGRDLQQEYIQNYIQRLENLIMQDGPIDKKRHDKIAAMMDLRSAADYWWIQEFSSNGDAFLTHSTYLYKPRNGKLYWGPLWDFDMAWGELFPEQQQDEYYEQWRKSFNRTTMLWLDHLRQYDPWYQDLLKERWDPHWNDPDGQDGEASDSEETEEKGMKAILEEMIAKGNKEDAGYPSSVVDQYMEELRSSWNADRELYPDDYEGFEGKTYDDIVDGFRNWVQDSINWVDANYKEKIGKLQAAARFMVDGQELAVVMVPLGRTCFDTPEEPKIEGQVFVGWFTEDGKSSNDVELYDDTDFTARYLPESEAVMPTAVYLDRQETWVPLQDNYDIVPMVEIEPEGVTDQRIKWSSSNESVATVQDERDIVIKGTGTTVLTVTCCNGVSNRIIYHVYDKDKEKAVEATGVRTEKSSYRLAQGQTEMIRLHMLPEGTPLTWRQIQYESSDDRVVSVNQYGAVKAVADGTATITVSVYGDEDKFLCKTTCQVIVGGKQDVVKQTNPVKAKGRTVKLREWKLWKKSRTIARKKAITIKNSQGKLSYKLVSATRKKGRKFRAYKKKRFTVNAKTGKITVKKRTRRGTYKLKIRVTDAGNDRYAQGVRTVTVKVRVR